MTITIGGIQVFLRDDTERFQANFRQAASTVTQQSARMQAAVQGSSRTVDNLARAAANVNPNAFRALALSALRAEDNVKRLESALLAVTALAGGFAGAFVVRGLIEAADQYRNIQNRIAAVVADESKRVAVNAEIFDIAQRSRAEYASTATLFARISSATEKLGVSSAEVLRVVETVQKSFAVAGSTTQEAQSAAIQLAQGLASGRLQGDELRSILENNIPLAKILARELAGGDIGRLRELGTEGALDPKAVFSAILRGGADIEAQFKRTEGTVQQALVGVSNALTRYVGETDKSFGATRGLVDALKTLADNFDTVVNSAALLAAAFGAIFIGNRIKAGIAAAAGPAAAFFATQREEVARLQAAVQDARNDLVRASFAGSGGDSPRAAAAALEASAIGRVSRAQEALNKLQEASTTLQGRLAAVATNTGKISESAARKREAAEKRIAALSERRAEVESAAAAAGSAQPDRSKLGGFYRAAFDIDAARSAFDTARANEAVAKAQAERFRQTMRLVGAEQDLAGAVPSGQSVNVSEYLKTVQAQRAAAEARIDAGQKMIQAERRFALEEEKLNSRQLSQAERYAAQITSIDQRIASERTKIARTSLAETAALTRAQAAAENQRLGIQKQIAVADAAIAQKQIEIGKLKAAADEAVATRLLGSAGNQAAAAALFKQRADAAADAQAKLAAATSVSGRAIGALQAVGGSLVGFLGGPWGIAFTAATVAIGVFGARAAAEAERVRRAQGIIEGALSRAGQRFELSPAGSDTILSRQISAVKADRIELKREIDKIQADLTQANVNLAKAGPSTGFAQAREELTRLVNQFTAGQISAKQLETAVSGVNGRFAGAAQLSEEFLRLAFRLREGQEAARQLDSEIANLEKRQVQITVSFRTAENASMKALEDFALRDQLEKNGPTLNLPEAAPEQLQALRLAKLESEILARAAGTAKQAIADRTQAIYEANRASGATIEWARRVAEAEYAASEARKGGARSAREAASASKSIERAYRSEINDLYEKAAADRTEAEGIARTKFERLSAAAALKAMNDLTSKANELGIKNFQVSAEMAANIQKAADASANAAIALDQVRDRMAALDSFRTTIGDTLGNAFVDVKTAIQEGATAIEAFRTAASNAFNALADQLLRYAAQQLVLAAFGPQGSAGILGGLFGVGGTTAAIFHGGGVVGGPAPTRTLPSSVFAGAPRFHSGLKSDEMAAVLQRGERVLTEKQNRRAVDTIDGLAKQSDGGMRRERPQINVNVSGATGNSEVRGMVAAGVREGLAAYDKSLPGRLRDYRQRGGRI